MAEKYRDSFFRFYFSDKQRLLSLCNALTGEDATDPAEIEITTLEETFFSKRKNDISCIFRGRLLVMIEQQSTLNRNMPLRFLLYVVKVLNQIYDVEFSRQLHSTKQITLPQMEFYVLYNGRKAAAEFEEMKLSDAVESHCDNLELKVKFYNINSPHNRELIKKSLPLEDYCVIVEKYVENRAAGMTAKAAFYKAYRFCMQTREWMLDFLKAHEWEMYDMISTEYHEEWAMAAQREEGRAEGLQEGRKEGRAEKVIEMVKNLLTTSLPVSEIARVVGWSEEKIYQFKDSLNDKTESR